MEMSETVHVEICQRIDSALPREDVQDAVDREINRLEVIKLNRILRGDELSDDVLKSHVESILFSGSHGKKSEVKVHEVTLKFYVYTLTQEEAATETMQNDSEELAVSSHWILPANEFHYLWENLYYDSDIKENLLHFVETAMMFADHNVDPNVIGWNKVVLLHGPPGTGKTSMCKALAQKLAIRLGHRFNHGELVEINSHSLFSKWFSESGKLVMKLFGEIKVLLENSQALVCILIDEIESLAHVRKSCANGVEPTDSIRVVNALLTQLDRIKRFPNVLILTTSNMTEAIDLAFVDRADIKQYIGHPTEHAIYKIYSSCLEELMRVGLLSSESIHDFSYLKLRGYEEDVCTKNSLKLLELSRESVGLSGRTLRKLPFLAHALHIQSEKFSLSRLLRAMHLEVQRQKEDDLE